MTHKTLTTLSFLSLTALLTTALAGGSGAPVTRTSIPNDTVIAGGSNRMLLNTAGQPVAWQNSAGLNAGLNAGLSTDEGAGAARYLLITVNGQPTRYTLTTLLTRTPNTLMNLRVTRDSAVFITAVPAIDSAHGEFPDATYTLVDAALKPVATIENGVLRPVMDTETMNAAPAPAVFLITTGGGRTVQVPLAQPVIITRTTTTAKVHVIPTMTAMPTKATLPIAGRSGGKVNLCHATGSGSNPYVSISVSANALPAHTAQGDFVKGGEPCPDGTAPGSRAHTGKLTPGAPASVRKGGNSQSTPGVPSSDDKNQNGNNGNGNGNGTGNGKGNSSRSSDTPGQPGGDAGQKTPGTPKAPDDKARKAPEAPGQTAQPGNGQK